MMTMTPDVEMDIPSEHDSVDYVPFEPSEPGSDRSFGTAVVVGVALSLPAWACLIAIFN